MFIEGILLYGLVILALVFIVEISKTYPLGIIAGALLIILGLFIITDNVQIVTSQTTVKNITTDTSVVNVTTSFENSTITNNYVDIVTPVSTLNETLGFPLLVIGLYGALHYWLETARIK